jgi:hypothetical protein
MFGRPDNRLPEGELRPAFYPAIITTELWDRAHKSIATRVAITAQGKITGKFCGSSRFRPQSLHRSGLERQFRSANA